MKLSLGRATATLAVAAGLSVATAGTALAQDLSVTDASGDVYSYTQDTDPGTAEPTVANGDIVKTVFRHTDSRVSARVKFRDLRRRSADAQIEIFRIVTNEGVRRDVALYAGDSPYRWSGTTEMSRPNGKTVACNITHQINYDTNVVTVSFPRTCVSSPRWIQVGLFSGRMTGGWNTLHLDDAQISGAADPNAPKLSTTKLRRG
jgi:hypothetical protein